MRSLMAQKASVHKKPPVVVIGAGPTGLSAAYHLQQDALLVEQNDRVGGWCRSVQTNGFTFDFAGHIMFSNDPYVHNLYQLLLGDNVHWQDREAWIFSKSVYTRYPFQGALHGLPADVIKECLLGAIEARLGVNGITATIPKPNGNGASISDENEKLLRGNCTGSALKDCCADGLSLEGCTEVSRSTGQPKNFEEFIYANWGAGIAKHFAIPYNKKLWAVPLTDMETSWIGGRVPVPDLEAMIDGALKPVPKPMGPNARFGYPLRGGFQMLMDGFLPHLAGPIRLSTRIVNISPTRHVVETNDGTSIPYDFLISTMPLPILVRLMRNEAPLGIQKAASLLRSVSVRCVHLGIGRENLTEKHWIYYPEDTVFHRIFVQGNASPFCNPKGGFGLTCEITYSPSKPLPCDGPDLIERCIQDCHKVGIFKPEDPIWATCQVDLPCAYVVYDHERARNVAEIRDWLSERNIILSGRYSEWEYYNSDHAFLAGKNAAEEVKEGLHTAENAKDAPLTQYVLGGA